MVVSARGRRAAGGTAAPGPNHRRAPVTRPQSGWWQRRRGLIALLAGGAIVVAVVAVAFSGRRLGTESTVSGGEAEAVGCSRTEQLTYHVHAHLAIFVEG